MKFLHRTNENTPPGHRSLVSSTPIFYFFEHLNELYFRNLGFPVAMHIPIGKFAGEIHGVLSEDLAHGAKLVEAHNFNFKVLKNGAELKRKFNEYVTKMMELKEKGHLVEDRHISKDDSSLAFKKTFFVRYNAKTKRGKLVMGDLDQIKFTQVAFDQDNFIKKTWPPLEAELDEIF